MSAAYAAKSRRHQLMTTELIATLCDHAQGNLRALMNMAGELLALAAQREASQIDEKLFSSSLPRPSPTQASRRVGVDERAARRQAYRLADRAEEQRWLVTGLWSEQAVGIVGGEPKCCKSFLALDLGRRGRTPAPPACCAASPSPGRGGCCCTRPRTPCMSYAEGSRASAPLRLANSKTSTCTSNHRRYVRIGQAADRERSNTPSHSQRRGLLVLDPLCGCIDRRDRQRRSRAVTRVLRTAATTTPSSAVLVVHHARNPPAHARRSSAARIVRVPCLGDSNLLSARSASSLTSPSNTVPPRRAYHRPRTRPAWRRALPRNRQIDCRHDTGADVR